MSATVDIVRRFRDMRVLVIGDVMLDSYLEGSASRICAEGPVPVVHKSGEERVPGGAANVAANLTALGANVILLGVIGADLSGRTLRTSLRDRGIDDTWLVEDPETVTLHKMRILANGQYVVRFDEGGTSRPSAGTRDELLATLEHVYAQCDAVVVSDYDYGVLSDELVDHLRALRARDPKVLAIDSKRLSRFAESAVTIITPNVLEAHLALGSGTSGIEQGDSPQTAARLGRRLIEATDAEHIAVTMGRAGVCLVDRRGSSRHIPAHPVSHSNDVGAGDSFLATSALALAAGASAIRAMRIAIEASCIAVGKRRTAVVHHQELLQRVSLTEHVTQSGRESSLRTLIASIDAAREQGKTVVFTNGIFDLLHAGHVEFLRRARELGDLLVVGVNSDRTTRLLKGERRPINGEQDRLALVRALDPVDHAILFDEEVPSALIRSLQPDIHVKGGDYSDVDLPEAEAVEEVGGRIVILPLAGSQATRQMIERIAVLAGADGLDGEL